MRAASAEPAIAVAHLAKRFGGVDAVLDLSLRVERATIFGFLGPNGAGKTTSVKMLLGLTRPTGGSGTVLGAPLGDRAARARIGYLPELFRYHDWMTAREELGVHAGLLGLPHRERSRAIDAVLATVGLATWARDRIGGFSKGMQQRLGLAVALLGSPELVFLDEPTSALDPIGRVEVRAILAGLRDRGTTVFLNSHLLDEVETLCDRVAITDRGRVIVEGAMREVVGDARGVRITCTGDEAAIAAALAPFGLVARDGACTTVAGVARDAVPDVVRAAVAAGAAVYAVEPAVATLEQRFLQALGR